MSTLDQPLLDPAPVREYERRLTLAIESIAQPPPSAAWGGKLQSLLLIGLLLVCVAIAATALIEVRRGNVVSQDANKSAAVAFAQETKTKLAEINGTLKSVEEAAKNLTIATSGMSDLDSNPQMKSLKEVLDKLSGAKAKLNDLSELSDKSGLSEQLRAVSRDIDGLVAKHEKLIEKVALVKATEDAVMAPLAKTLEKIDTSYKQLQATVNGESRPETVVLVTTRTAKMPATILIEAAQEAKENVEKKYRLTHEGFHVELMHGGHTGLIPIGGGADPPDQTSKLAGVRFESPPRRYVIIGYADALTSLPSLNHSQVVDVLFIVDADELKEDNKARESNSYKHLRQYGFCRMFCSSSNDEFEGEANLFIAKFEQQGGQPQFDVTSKQLLVETIVRLATPRREWPLPGPPTPNAGPQPK